uniref:GMP reductase n=1 Tax=viral metagenome TaxID=1070528 RepID=A0A6C0DW43_9ZZZZ
MRRFLTFDDVGLVPKFNKIVSRLHTDIKTQIGKDSFKSPFIPANMDSVIGPRLAQICKERGAPIIFHRFAPIEEQVKWVKEFPEAYMSLGVQESANNLEALYETGCRRFCIDIAHGHSQVVIDTIKKIKDFDRENQVIAGNVCTYEGVMDLAKAGADIVKVGVGPGAACITRMMTGFGVPQFSAIRECSSAKHDLLYGKSIKIELIADGGIKHPRDAVLALAAGADAVMMGSIFARTFESAAPKREVDGKTFGRYRGQASSEFMNEYFGDTKKRQAEGVAFDVEITKSAVDVFEEYEGGLRSGLTYSGTNNLDNFRKNTEIFESTGNFMIESSYRN